MHPFPRPNGGLLLVLNKEDVISFENSFISPAIFPSTARQVKVGILVLYISSENKKDKNESKFYFAIRCCTVLCAHTHTHTIEKEGL